MVETESEVLQYASGNVSESFGIYGSWAFLPVIDQDYIQERPSVQLSKGLVAGRRILVGVSLHFSIYPSLIFAPQSRLTEQQSDNLLT